jgi:hypothetical protein
MVLKWKCKGLEYLKIAGRLGYSVAWVQLQMSTAYRKLGFNSSMHWTQRKKILEKEICPRLPKDIEGWVPKQETIEETREDPEMLSLVLYDEAKLTTIEGEVVEGPIILKPRPTPLITKVAVAGAGGTAVLGVICLAVLVALYLLRPLWQPQAVPIVQPTRTMRPQATVAPTDAPPPVEPTRTEVPFPTEAFKDFYELDEPAPLAENVYIKLTGNDLDNASEGFCYRPSDQQGFVLSLYIDNRSNSTFLAKYDGSFFHATDDVGTQYQLYGAGYPSCYPPSGPKTFQVFPTDTTKGIVMYFKGQIPFEAKYLILTVDYLSGVRLVFHRQL